MLPSGDLRRSFWAKVLGLSMRKGRIMPKYHYVYGIPSLEKNYAPRGGHLVRQVLRITQPA